jgi:hypothetical protein
MNSLPAVALCTGYWMLTAKRDRGGFGGRDTGSMGDQWVHVGRLWTNGDPFLAVDAGPFVNARSGPVPSVHGPPSREVGPGLLISARHTEYKLKVRWYTRLDEDNCFARWLLIPAQAND